MIGGEAADRILKEVMRGIPESLTDTPEEAAYRKEIVQQVQEIHDEGGMVDIPADWP